jgi:hypothetical protein
MSENSGSVDWILMSNEVATPENVRQANRVLKPGGALILAYSAEQDLDPDTQMTLIEKFSDFEVGTLKAGDQAAFYVTAHKKGHTPFSPGRAELRGRGLTGRLLIGRGPPAQRR